jgi:asparagine synthase (glutamine-hydrolysing)
MNLSIKHRGPDGDGRFVDGAVGMGNRRLSIIDLEGGTQPIANENGCINVVFNGEIYNFVELRKELEAEGHRFRTNSDTEVIVHAYEKWGKKCVEHFNGMFAFAVWDSLNRELFLARDHLGIKPLYYVDLGQRVLFASEIKALLQDPECPREVDVDALCELFSFRFVPSPKTLFNGIRKVPPGHSMTLSSRGIEIQRFWKWVPKIRASYDEAALVEEYRALLEDSVRIQLRSDVPVGLFLSSGIDSGALLSIMSRYSQEPVRCLTIGFEGGDKTNEIEGARIRARFFGARHSFRIIRPEDYVRYYERYLSDIEEPLGNETAAAFYFVSQLAREQVKVALTGQGADEPWAGYHRYLGAKVASYGRFLPGWVAKGLATLMLQIPGRWEQLQRGALSVDEPDVLTQFAKIYSFFDIGTKRRLFKGELKEVFARDEWASRKALSRLQCDVKKLDAVAQMAYIDTRASLPDDLLMVADKTSMAVSLEARVPYLDYRLIEFIETLPSALKLRGLTGKYLHKRAIEKWLPKESVYQKKLGFSNPIENWFRNQLRPFVEECLLSQGTGTSQYFDQTYIREMLELDRSGRRQLRRQIYLLVSFEMWYRTFMRS